MPHSRSEGALRGRRQSLSSVCAGLACVLLGLRVSYADGKLYVDAYNALVGMVNDRAHAVGRSAMPELPADTAVSQGDLDTLRNKVRSLMSYRYAAPPAYYPNPNDGTWYYKEDAFPPLKHALVEEGVLGAGGTFTVVPAEYTSDGAAIRTTRFGTTYRSVPLLWVHFQELHQVLTRMRFHHNQTLPLDSSYAWSGRCKSWSGEGGNRSDAVAAAIAERSDDPRTGWDDSNPQTHGTSAPPNSHHQVHRGGYPRRWRASVVRVQSVLTVRNIAPVRSRTAHLYAKGVRAGGSGHALSTFGDVGKQWGLWCSKSVSSSTFQSSGIGGLDWPSSSPAFLQGDEGIEYGYKIKDIYQVPAGDSFEVIFELKDPLTTPIECPSKTDSPRDGIVDTGCRCTDCGPGVQVQFGDNEGDPEAKFYLGSSSAVGAGNVVVEALVREYRVSGEPEQMFNLDTALTAVDGPTWGFATVKRPSGAAVIFGLRGEAAGEPVDVRNPYRMEKKNNEYQLSFPGEGGKVVHRFVEPGMIDHIYVIGNGVSNDLYNVRDGGPGLTVVRGGGGIDYALWAGTRAVPVYGGDLIRSIRYFKTPEDTEYAAEEVVAGSRIFRSRIVSGTSSNVVNETRVVDAGDSVRILRGVRVTNGYARAALRETRTERLDSTSGVLRAETEFCLDPDGIALTSTNAVEQEEQPWGLEVVRRIAGYGADAPRVTAYSYYTDPQADGDNYGRLKRVEYPDGTWKEYAYDALGRVTSETGPVGDTPPASSNQPVRVVRRLYRGDAELAALGFPAGDTAFSYDFRPRAVITELRCAGATHEESRTYYAYVGTTSIVQRCLTPGAPYGHPSNLVAVTEYCSSGGGLGRPSRTVRPDGTASIYSYVYDAGDETLTTTRDSGAANAAGNAIVAGVRTVTVLDAAGRTESVRSTDIESGIDIAHTLYTDRDAFGRAKYVKDALAAGSPRVTAESAYGCCGLEDSYDAQGVHTHYAYNDLHQVYVTEHAGLMTIRKYDQLGNTREEIVQENLGGATTRIVSKRVWNRDAAGRVRGTTAYSYNEDGDELVLGETLTHAKTAEGGRVMTTTYADGTTRVETYYRDGQLKSLTGTAVSPYCYVTGIDTGGVYSIAYSGTNTNATAWVKTYSDMLGRATRDVYPDGYTRNRYYNDKGQLHKTDDGFTRTFTFYNSRGEAFRTAIDMDRDGRIDLAGTDRIAETRSTYTNIIFDGENYAVRQTVNRSWRTAGSDTPTVVSTSRASVDGDHSWNIAFGRVSHTAVTRDRAARTRTVTVTRPDRTQSVSHYTNGLLAWTELRATNDTVVSRIDYAQTPAGLRRTIAVKAPDPSGSTRGTIVHNHGFGAADYVETYVGAELVETTRYEYDSMQRLWKTTLPGNGVVEYLHTDRGELRRQSGARTYPVEYAYDPQGRMRTLSTFRDGATPDTTEWIYDPQRGWLAEKKYADDKGPTYAYHKNGRLKQRTWARGNETVYRYDSAGGLTNIDYSAASDTDITYTYKRDGRLQSVTDAIGARTFTHAPDGRVDTETMPSPAGWTLDHDYQPATRGGRRQSLTVDSVNTVTYTRDNAGRLATVGDTASGITATYGYAPNGATHTTTTLATPAGDFMRTTRHFDGRSRLTNIVHTALSGATPGLIQGYRYEHNDAGLRRKCTLADGSYWIYDYDDLGQVTGGRKYRSDGSAIEWSQFSYAFDRIGNRTASRDNLDSADVERGYTANALNQYTEVTEPSRLLVMGDVQSDVDDVRVGLRGRLSHSASRRSLGNGRDRFWSTVAVTNGAGPVWADLAIRALKRTNNQERVRTETRGTLVSKSRVDITHDDDGNLLNDGRWQHTWNGENRLIAIESITAAPETNRVKCTFVYDYMGRRAKKMVYRRNNATWALEKEHTFVYDGWNLTMETAVSAVQTTTNFYLWGQDLSGTLQGAGGIGGLLAITTPTTTHTPCFDGNGNVMSLMDPTTATPTATYEYSPFGQTTESTGAAAPQNPFRFSTKYTDNETALVYYGYRYYCPRSGRWPSRDPIGEEGGLNVYGFVWGNPFSLVDTDGRKPFGTGFGESPFYSPGIGGREEFSYDQFIRWELTVEYLLRQSYYLGTESKLPRKIGFISTVPNVLKKKGICYYLNSILVTAEPIHGFTKGPEKRHVFTPDGDMRYHPGIRVDKNGAPNSKGFSYPWKKRRPFSGTAFGVPGGSEYGRDTAHREYIGDDAPATYMIRREITSSTDDWEDIDETLTPPRVQVRLRTESVK